MNEPKIGWKRREGENAWTGVRGRIKFFTLRIVEPDEITDEQAELHDWRFLLVYHTENARQAHLEPMPLSAAKAHAERELDLWLAKAGLVEGEPFTPTRHAINSAQNIIDACVADGIRGLVTEYERERFAERIALYSVLSTLTELATITHAVGDEVNLADAIEKRREELYEVMKGLKELI